MYDVLLFVSAAAAASFADTLRLQHDLAVHIAHDRASALEALRRQSFALIVLDEALTSADPRGADLFYKHAASASTIEVSFVFSNGPRVVRQIRGALARRAQDRASALATATASLQGELGASLTGLLLESELVLRAAPPALAPRLKHLVMLAGNLQNRLRA